MRMVVVGGSREAEILCARLAGAAMVEGASLPGQFDADAVVDACHPCERDTPRRVADRCAANGVPLLRLRRAPWQASGDDRWIGAADAKAACEALNADWRRVFLCLGEADRVPFADDADRWYLVRTRQLSPEALLPEQHEVTGKAGPFSVGYESALMTGHRIDVLVTRNAGGQGALPKVLAARALGLPVVMLARPLALGQEVATIEEALSWLDSCAVR